MAKIILSSVRRMDIPFAFGATKGVSVHQEEWLWTYTIHKFIPVNNLYAISSKVLRANRPKQTCRLEILEGSYTMAWSLMGDFSPVLGAQFETPQSSKIIDLKFPITRSLNKILDLISKSCVKIRSFIHVCIICEFHSCVINIPVL